MNAFVSEMPETTLLAKAALPPFRLVASCQVAASSWLLVMPLKRASGTVPPFRLLALSEVRFVPLPANVVAVTAPEKFGLAGSAPLATVPLNCAAGRIPSKLLALLATTAYGVGVKLCAGLKAAKPWTPSLNQICNCKFGWLNNAALIAAMFGIVVSPRPTENNPFVTPMPAAAAGSLPLVLVPSLLQ